MRTLPARLGTVPNTFEYSRDDDFAGGELKNVFNARLPSKLSRIAVYFNDSSLSGIQVTVSAVSWIDGVERTLFQEYGNGAVEHYEDEILLGGNEFLSIKTVGLVGGTPPGGKIIIVGRVLR